METPATPQDGHGPLVGRPVRRREDARLLTGAGRFVADVAPAGQAHAVVLRSPHAHAAIRSIATAAARGVPGVVAVLTAADAAADGLGGIPWEVRPPSPDVAPAADAPPPGAPEVAPPQPVLARDRVRYVGEPVALVVGETADAAKDGAERVAVDYAPLPAVVSAARAARPGAPVLHDMFPDNVCFVHRAGDAAATAAAFARAAHVVRLEAANNRLIANPTEPRGYIGAWDAAAERYTLSAALGKPHPVRDTLAAFVFGVPPARIRVVAEDVGGGFGARNVVYPEEALVLWAARRTGRAVRWIGERGEGFLSDTQGRDQTTRAALALDGDGRILALRAETFANLGAWLSPRGAVPPGIAHRVASGVYAIPCGHIEVRAVLTNTVPTGPYRGAGQPEVNFVVERLMDLAARELGRDPVDFRRRNLIAEEAMPYRTAFGLTYDGGVFERNMDAALARADAAGFAARRAASRAAGRLRGLAATNCIEATASGIGDTAEVRCDGAGRVSVLLGTMSNGQSHQTAYAQIVADRLGVGLDAVEVVQGDTDRVATGRGTGASRSMVVGGSAALLAAGRLVERGREVAAGLLEAAAEDIAFAAGRFTVAGTDRAAGLAEVAAAAGGLAASAAFDPPNHAYPSGCHVCEVEVDPETGAVDIVGYTVVHDAGVEINPMVVDGQAHGGVAQGIGQALMERAAYDGATGQLLSGSFMDYAMPRAADLPAFRTATSGAASPSNPLGVRPAGESGTTGAPQAVIGAIVDALSAFGVRHIDMPATPETVLRAMGALRHSPMRPKSSDG